MSPVLSTWWRTIGMSRSLYSTALAIAAFLSIASASFVFALGQADGGRLSLAVVWAISVAPILPALAAFLGMDTWSDERQSGRISTLLSIAVKERDYVIGKFLGIYTIMVASLLLLMVASLIALWCQVPESVGNMRLVAFVPAVFILLLQGAVWCATAVAMSALFCRAAAAAFSSVVLTIALPRGIWAGLKAWGSAGGTAFGEMPLDAHVIDFAGGMFSVGTMVSYVAVTLAMLFVASKAVAALRFVGRGATALRGSTVLVSLLALVSAWLVVASSHFIDLKLDLPISGMVTALSPRTRNVLAESSGEITITCFLPRNDTRFRQIGNFLRMLRNESESIGGARITLRFIDPRWDLGAAERFVRNGITTDSLVFERGHRSVVIPIASGYGERVCASAIRRLAVARQRSDIYWTFGHGERRFDDYGTFGMSDIARELSREGYQNVSFDIAVGKAIPSNCAMMVIAGAKDDFSRSELDKIDAYLRGGGRVLVLLESAEGGGIVSILPSWGVRVTSDVPKNAKTMTGTDVIVSDFSEHSITTPLKDSRIVLDRPVALSPSSAVKTSTGADGLDYIPIADVGGITVATVVERGSGAGNDLAIRPTRIIVIGDSNFVLNGEIQSKANANRDFFVNCVSYLAGTDAFGANGTESDVLVVGLDRAGTMRLLMVLVGIVPVFAFGLLLIPIIRRRRRA